MEPAQRHLVPLPCPHCGYPIQPGGRDILGLVTDFVWSGMTGGWWTSTDAQIPKAHAKWFALVLALAVLLIILFASLLP